jgi:hypothetical protein
MCVVGKELTSSSASSISGPLIDTWRRANIISFFRQLRSLVFILLMALPPLSGHALLRPKKNNMCVYGHPNYPNFC